MKYARCSKCELNYVKNEGDLCEYCLRGENCAEELYCQVCGEEYADGDDGLCSACRREINMAKERDF